MKAGDQTTAHDAFQHIPFRRFEDARFRAFGNHVLYFFLCYRYIARIGEP